MATLIFGWLTIALFAMVFVMGFGALAWMAVIEWKDRCYAMSLFAGAFAFLMIAIPVSFVFAMLADGMI